jgi:ribonuclease HI
MKELKIYCDGGMYNQKREPNKPIFGSYGAIIVRDNKVIYKFNDFYEEDENNLITNNRMELFGFIKAYTEFLKRYKSKDKYHITVISDSQYLIKGINEWLPGWKKRRWKNSSGNIIENLYMWKIIDKLLVYNPNIKLEFVWQKGHKGKSVSLKENPDIYFNEMVDSMATESINEASNPDKWWFFPEGATFEDHLKKIGNILGVKE